MLKRTFESATIPQLEGWELFPVDAPVLTIKMRTRVCRFKKDKNTDVVQNLTPSLLTLLRTLFISVQKIHGGNNEIETLNGVIKRETERDTLTGKMVLNRKRNTERDTEKNNEDSQPTYSTGPRKNQNISSFVFLLFY